MTSTVTATAKNAHTAVMKKYRWSTRAAIVDACSGNSGMPGSMCALTFLDSICGAPGVRVPRQRSVPLAPPHQHDRRAARHERQHAGNPDQRHHGEAVPAARRVVVKAIQEDIVDRAADLPIGGLDQRQPQIARPVLDAVEVVRQPALRRRDHDAAGVRELTDRRVVGVAKADRAGQRRDLAAVAGEEMPAGLPPPGGCSARCSSPSWRAPVPACLSDRS